MRQVGDAYDLMAAGQFAQFFADDLRRLAADARVDFVEHQGRDAVAGGEQAFDGQHDSRQFAARSDAAQRLERFAGVGGQQKLDSIDAVRRDREASGGEGRSVVLGSRIAPKADGELGAFHVQFGQLLEQILFETARGFLARGAEGFGLGDERGLALAEPSAQAFDFLAAIGQAGQPRFVAAQFAENVFDAFAILARQIADQVQAVLDGFEPAGVAFGRQGIVAHAVGKVLQLVAHGGQRVAGGGFERIDFGQAGELGFGHSDQFERRGGAFCAFAQQGVGARGGGLQAVGVAQPAAFGGQRLVFARPQIGLADFANLMLEHRLFALQGALVAEQRLQVLARLAPFLERSGHRPQRFVVAGIGVEGRQMVLRIEQGLVLVLSVQIDQRFAQGMQLMDRRQPPVEAGFAFAREGDFAAQHQFAVLGRQIGFGQQRGGGRAGADFDEGFGDGGFGAGADILAGGPLAQHKAQRVENNRFARARFAG
ncbi:MAG: hypothetical protein BWZ10_02781 [candidate division BRC1 bacterium ADurb.BinA364]|nr:MAG: hypothetical protein BWZ10_02781 [candidate division BRC1 bacterium ADurb.BinA364]